jgi:hypothetical protein
MPLVRSKCGDSKRRIIKSDPLFDNCLPARRPIHYADAEDRAMGIAQPRELRGSFRRDDITTEPNGACHRRHHRSGE